MFSRIFISICGKSRISHLLLGFSIFFEIGETVFLFYAAEFMRKILQFRYQHRYQRKVMYDETVKNLSVMCTIIDTFNRYTVQANGSLPRIPVVSELST